MLTLYTSQAELAARDEYLYELHAEHFDPCVGPEDKPAPVVTLKWDLNPNLADDHFWIDY
jgi:hypothetical protein